MDSIKLALIGCGGMGFRHLHGFIELKKCGFEDIELIAVCDLNQNNAWHVALGYSASSRPLSSVVKSPER